MRHLTLVHSSDPTAADKPGFTSHDLIALTCWKHRADTHGYGRVLLEGGSGKGGPEAGSYVLIYAPGCEWASWGLSRGEGEIVVWHCGSGADLGRFATMLQALESLPPVWTATGRKRPEPVQPAPRLYLVQSA